MSASAIKIEWRVCTTSERASLRRIPRVNGREIKQERNRPRGKGRRNSGPKQTETKLATWRKLKEENRSKSDGK